MKEKEHSKKIALIIIIVCALTSLLLKASWNLGGQEWTFWASQYTWSFVLFSFGVYAFVNKITFKELPYKQVANSRIVVSKRNLISFRIFWIFISLLGVINFALTLWKALLGCTPSNC